MDLTQVAGYRDLLAGVHVVVHCAGIAHNKGSAEAYEQVNVRGTMALADAAIAAGVKRFIFISSLNIVDPRVDDPTAMASTLPMPDTPYARSKWRGEQALEQLLGHSPCDLIIVRPGLIYDGELTANLKVLARLAHWLPLCLPETGHRAMVSRPDLAGLLVTLAQAEYDQVQTIRWVAIDGEAYSVRRIAEALGASGCLSVPLRLWRLLMALRDVATGQSVGSGWQSLAGEYWYGDRGMSSSTGATRPTETLEQRLRLEARGAEP